jgi:hypothetical protein
MVAEALGRDGNPAQYLIAQKYLEALAQFGKDSDKTVFMPYEASGVMASVGGIRELFDGVKAPAPR